MNDADLANRIRDEIALEGGAITFARFMEMALYDPEQGYYRSAQRKPGRGGDFITAPEVSPYFGITLARQLAECWERLGKPASWTIREHGAGIGGLAYDIIAGLSTESPDAAAGLQYRLVETNPHRLAEALAAMAEVGLADVVAGESDVEVAPIVGVVLANEVADAQPVHRLVVRNGKLLERWVAIDGDGFTFEDRPLSQGVTGFPHYFETQDVALIEDAVYDVSPAAEAWFAGTCRGIERGYAIVLDYGYPARELYAGHRLGGTLRGYHAHTVTADILGRIGEQDLTAHVDFTALQRAGEAEGMTFAGFTTQGALLASLGLGDVLLGLRRDPSTTMPEYLAAQAVVMRLIDPGGLGRFGILMMARNAPTEPPLRALAISPPPF